MYADYIHIIFVFYFVDTVPILTSTVIECHRVGFQKAAFSYASMLMRAEYRNQIDQKYAKKIEAIVRKAPNGIKEVEDPYQDEASQCPICECKLQIMELACHQCKTNLPMCIATVIFFLDQPKRKTTLHTTLQLLWLFLGSTCFVRRCSSMSIL